MTRTQTIFCFSVREPDTALSPLAIHFECVQISVFCYIFVIVDRSKANTWKCLRGKHLTSNSLKTWRDLAITSAALGRLFDARLVRPPLQAHTKAVQLAKKGQVNNVLPSCKLNETLMLRLQTVVQSTLFPKKKAPGWRICQNLRKERQSWRLLTPSSPYARLRWPSSSSAEHVLVTCQLRCRVTWHLISWVLSNTVLQPNKKAFRQPSGWRGTGRSPTCQYGRSPTSRSPTSRSPTSDPACRAGSIECQTTACAGACVEHSAGGASAVELVLVWTQIRVSIMVFFLRVLSLDTSSDLFSPLPTRSLPHKYAWQQPTSIVDLSAQEPCRFFSRKAGQLWTLNKQP